jgi:hypothetical protein
MVEVMVPHRRNRKAVATLAKVLGPEGAAVRIAQAIGSMRVARVMLRSAGANNAADYVARAIKSAEGALRHARHRANRTGAGDE